MKFRNSYDFDLVRKETVVHLISYVYSTKTFGERRKRYGKLVQIEAIPCSVRQKLFESTERVFEVEQLPLDKTSVRVFSEIVMKDKIENKGYKWVLQRGTVSL